MPAVKRPAQKRPNKNGANQYKPDPRQSLCLQYYIDPNSASFGNMTQSGMRAGFEEVYSRNLMNLRPTWLSTKLEQYQDNQSRLILKAERNLEDMLDLPSQVQAMGPFGPLYEKVGKKVRGKAQKKKPVMTYAGGLIKIKNDVSQFVAERVGRKKWGADVPQGNQTLILMVTGESAKRYGIVSNPQPKPSSD